MVASTIVPLLMLFRFLISDRTSKCNQFNGIISSLLTDTRCRLPMDTCGTTKTKYKFVHANVGYLKLIWLKSNCGNIYRHYRHICICSINEILSECFWFSNFVYFSWNSNIFYFDQYQEILGEIILIFIYLLYFKLVNVWIYFRW